MIAKNRRKKILELIVYFIMGYCALLLFLYIMQRSFIYFPAQNLGRPSEYGLSSMEGITVETEDGLKLTGWFQPPADHNKPVIVMFHGNGGHIGIRNFKADGFIKRGYGFLLAEYRGYGDNPGKPSEEGFYNDGKAYIDWLIEDNNVQKQHIVLYGESLGSGVAVQMAQEYQDFAAMVLEAPFTSLPDLAKPRFFYVPLQWLMRDRYHSARKIGDVRLPILIIHGRRDMIVPFRFGEKLYEAANEPKVMEDFDFGMHNDLYMHGAGDVILRFLDKYVSGPT